MYYVKEEWHWPGSGRFCADWLRSVSADAWLAVLSGLQCWKDARGSFPSATRASLFSNGGEEEGRGGTESDAIWTSTCVLNDFFLSLGEAGLEETFLLPLPRTGLISGECEQLKLLFGDEIGSDSLEQPTLFFHLFPSLLCWGPCVAEGGLHWKDMGSKSKVEMPAAGGHRSRSSSWCGGEIHAVVQMRSAPLWLSFSWGVLWSCLILVLCRSSLLMGEMASLVERGLTGR